MTNKFYTCPKCGNKTADYLGNCNCSIDGGQKMESENKGFDLICLNCKGRNVNIDFENDVFWCSDCKNTMGCLDYGKHIDDETRLNTE